MELNRQSADAHSAGEAAGAPSTFQPSKRHAGRSANDWSQAPDSGEGRPPFDAEQALLHLQTLGIDPATAWFRSIRHRAGANPRRKGADLRGFDATELEAESRAGAAIYVIPNGHGSTASGTRKGRPTGAVVDADITECRVVFAEWDQGTLTEQQARLDDAGLPTPSLLLHTGGKSLHAYWLLTDSVDPQTWREAMARLIEHTDADPACRNPSRVMRLAGSPYINKATGKPTGAIAEIIDAPGHRYDLATLLAALPELEPEPEPEPVPRRRAIHPDANGAPDEATRARLMLDAIKPADFAAYDDWLEVGMALNSVGPELLDDWIAWSQQIPGYGRRADRLECAYRWRTFKANQPGGVTIATLHRIARDRYGYREPRRTRSSNSRKPASDRHPPRQQGQRRRDDGASPPNGGWPPADTYWPAWTGTPRKLSHTQRINCLERCIRHEVLRQRNSLRRRARLLRFARKLGLAKEFGPKEIAQRVLEAQAGLQGHDFRPLSADDRAVMGKPTVEWLIPDLIPANDLTIVGGRPKVGKSRVSFAITHAVVEQIGFLGSQPPAEARPVILVTDDQADGDSADMLDMLGLWDHPLLYWSRHFRVTEQNLDRLLAAIDANPGALVVLDSLRSISRCLPHGENDPEIGATLYDLKQAVIDHGGTLLLIHHCNKAENLSGVEALSGHTAIPGAANAVFTLHYLIGEHGPLKDDPLRRLVREGRSGLPLDIVISGTAGTGKFHKVCPYADWKQQIKEAQKQENTTEQQKKALAVIETEPERWWTVRDVTEELGLHWEASRQGDGQGVRRSLDRLAQLGLAESIKVGNAKTYRSTRPTRTNHSDDLTPLTLLLKRNGSERSQEVNPFDSCDSSESTPDQGANRSQRGDSSESTAPEGRSHESHPQVPTPRPEGATPVWVPELCRLVAERPGATAAELAIALDPTRSGQPKGRDVKPWLDRIRAELEQPQAEPPPAADAPAAMADP